MGNFNFEIFGLNEKEKIAKIYQEIYSSPKSSDSPGSFSFKRTRETNSTII